MEMMAKKLDARGKEVHAIESTGISGAPSLKIRHIPPYSSMSKQYYSLSHHITH
jgi:hypothetical protein